VKVIVLLTIDPWAVRAVEADRNVIDCDAALLTYPRRVAVRWRADSSFGAAGGTVRSQCGVHGDCSMNAAVECIPAPATDVPSAAANAATTATTESAPATRRRRAPHNLLMVDPLATDDRTRRLGERGAAEPQHTIAIRVNRPFGLAESEDAADVAVSPARDLPGVTDPAAEATATGVLRAPDRPLIAAWRA
jgi:hypothetical protein